MCRLFAMSGGAEPVNAKLWLLEAPDSLTRQSHRNPDGTGLGIFDAEGRPVVHKAPISAFSDKAFASEARSERSRTFLAHVRFASTGAKTLANTHPFEQDGRLFAHNGVLAGLPQLDQELGDDRALVHGETDSERLFALITREIRRHDGDIHAGIVAGASWAAAQLPIYCLNLIISTESELFALRYPDNNKLYVLERGAGGVGGEQALHQHSSLGTRVNCEQAAQRPIVVLASEPMDEDPGWRALQPGELLHVGPELEVSSAIVLPDPPAHLLDLSTLSEQGRKSQSSGPGAG
jgi:predicted glutamine amidotransferase